MKTAGDVGEEGMIMAWLEDDTLQRSPSKAHDEVESGENNEERP